MTNPTESSSLSHELLERESAVVVAVSGCEQARHTVPESGKSMHFEMELYEAKFNFELIEIKNKLANCSSWLD